MWSLSLDLLMELTKDGTILLGSDGFTHRNKFMVNQTIAVKESHDHGGPTCAAVQSLFGPAFPWVDPLGAPYLGVWVKGVQ